MASYTRKRGRNTQSRNRARRRNARRSKNVASQTKANTRAIADLRSQTLGWRQYQLTSVGTIDAKLHVERLHDIKDQWTGIFQAASADPVRTYNLSSVRVKYAFQTESDTTGNQWFQMWIVSLKPKFSREFRANTNDGFALVDGEHYAQVAMGTSGGTLQGFGNVWLNPAYFNIHHTTGFRRIGQTTMGSTVDGNVTNIRDSTHFGGCSFKYKKTIKCGEHRANGFLDLEQSDILDKNCLYTIVFSNAGATSELFRSINYVFTGRTIGTN